MVLATGSTLLNLYIPLVGWVLAGFWSRRWLPRAVPDYLGKFLFWIGVPLGIVGFMQRTHLSLSLWIAPVAAWVAILLGAGLSWLWLKTRSWAKPTQGSFLLASMLGNTGYLGFPVTLALVGPQYFGWALFYDAIGTTFGAYGLGVLLAAYFGQSAQKVHQLLLTLIQNPALWGFGVGLTLPQGALPPLLEQGLYQFAWAMVTCSLVLLGMRLSQLSGWQSLRRVGVSLVIKMILVPLVVGGILVLGGVKGAPLLAIVLQMAMPPAFATLVLAEAFGLDRNLTVTALAAGSTGLLFTLPVWVWLFG